MEERWRESERQIEREEIDIERDKEGGGRVRDGERR